MKKYKIFVSGVGKFRKFREKFRGHKGNSGDTILNYGWTQLSRRMKSPAKLSCHRERLKNAILKL